MSGAKELVKDEEWRRRVDEAVDALDDRNPHRRQDAIEDLAHLRSAPPELLDLLADDSNSYVRQAAARALGVIFRESAASPRLAEAIDALLGAVQDQSDFVSTAAIAALGELKAREAIDDLCDLLDSDDKPRIKIEAVRALGMIGDRRAGPAIERRFATRDRRLLTAVVRAAGRLELAGCGAKVAAVLEEAAYEEGGPEFDLCRACLRTIEQLNYAAATPLLIRLAKDCVGVRKMAVQALIQVAPAEAAAALAEMLDDPHPQLRAELIALMEKADYRPAGDRIRAALGDSSVEVRRAALAAVTAFGDSSVVDIVREMAFGDPNAFVRPQAVESLVALAGFRNAHADLARLLSDTNAKVRAIAERMLREAAPDQASDEAPLSPTFEAPQTLRWIGDETGELRLLDQTRLPLECVELTCRDSESVYAAIRKLAVRGAPAIGIAAAYGLVLGLQSADVESDSRFFERLREVKARLASSRPTAVNLFWALDRMEKTANSLREAPPRDILARLLNEARAIHEEDRETCRAIGRQGAELFADGQGVLTHCNAGGLATAEYGTSLAAIFTAHEQGKKLHVYVDETRPLLQGARLTAWELVQRGIPATLICDSMAATVMRQGKVQAVIVGADRIAANGDTANKIGTYALALVAAAHGVPFYVAAPISTFDLSLASGDEIPIEERAAEEITRSFGKTTAPAGVGVYNPAFDVTPANLIRGIITERGVISPVSEERVREMISWR